MSALIGAIDRQDHDVLSTGLKIYSDKLGEVTPDELDQFFGEFAATGAPNSAAPLRLTNWGTLAVADTNPLYVITVARGAADGSHWSAWLVGFASDRISLLRRADELWPFADGRHFFAPEHCSEAPNG
jgi:hypothetical protein